MTEAGYVNKSEAGAAVVGGSGARVGERVGAGHGHVADIVAIDIAVDVSVTIAEATYWSLSGPRSTYRFGSESGSRSVDRAEDTP